MQRPNGFLLLGYALIFLTASCAQQAPSKLRLRAIELPASNLQLVSVEPSAGVNSLRSTANELNASGETTGQRIAATFRLEGGASAEFKALDQLRLQTSEFAACQTADGQIVLLKGRTSDTPSVWSASRSGIVDITPDNLAEVFQRPGRPGRGINQIDSNGNLLVRIPTGDEQQELWVGKQHLTQVGATEPGSRFGSSYDNDGLRRLALSPDGTVLVLDPDTQKFVPSVAAAWAGQAIKLDQSLTQEHKLGPVVTDRVAALKLKEEIKIYGVDGSIRSIRLFSPVNEQPQSGLPRSAAEVNEMIRHPRSLVEEGRSLPEDVASRDTQIVPLDSKTIALVDQMYYRVILVDLEEAADPAK